MPMDVVADQLSSFQLLMERRCDLIGKNAQGEVCNLSEVVRDLYKKYYEHNKVLAEIVNTLKPADESGKNSKRKLEDIAE